MKRSPFRQIVLSLALAAATVCVAGCGTPTAEVSGTIKINGKAPSTKGLEIAFLSSDGVSIKGAPIDADGKYSAVEVPAGEVKVYFIYTPEGITPTKGGRTPLKKAGPKDGADPKGKAVDESKNPVPPLLREPFTSKITATIKSGEKNVFDYDMKP